MNTRERKQWDAVAGAFLGSVYAVEWMLAYYTATPIRLPPSVLAEGEVLLDGANIMRERVVRLAEQLLNGTDPSLKLYELLYAVTDTSDLEVTTRPAEPATMTTEAIPETWCWEPASEAIIANVRAVTALLDSVGGDRQLACVACGRGGRS